MEVFLDDEGKVRIPLEALQQAGIKTGTLIEIAVSEGQLQLRPATGPLVRAHTIVARVLGDQWGKTSVADELLAERREEARREAEES